MAFSIRDIDAHRRIVIVFLYQRTGKIGHPAAQVTLPDKAGEAFLIGSQGNAINTSTSSLTNIS
ncbi:MAG: hypothetical protein ABI363_05835 [Nitrosospira sp.]